MAVTPQGIFGGRRVTMRVADGALDELTRLAGTLGLDGSDRGAIRRFLWAEVGSDAVDHDAVDALAERLVRLHG